MRALSSLFFNISSLAMASVDLREIQRYTDAMKTNVPFIFIHILHEEVTLTITSNGSAFAIHRG